MSDSYALEILRKALAKLDGNIALMQHQRGMAEQKIQDLDADIAESVRARTDLANAITAVEVQVLV